MVCRRLGQQTWRIAGGEKMKHLVWLAIGAVLGVAGWLAAQPPEVK